MINAVRLLLLTGLFSVFQVAAEPETGQPESVFSAAADTTLDEASLRKLKKGIADAAAQQIFVVHLIFDTPTTIEELHAAALQLRIPRVLAYVEYGTLYVDRPRDSLILGLGEMYATGTASRHTRCQALISVSHGEENELRDQAIEDWMVSKIQVYATAHAIRELLAGTILPAADVVDGNSAEMEHVSKLAAYTRQEVSGKIEIPGNIDPPDQCEHEVATPDAPILVAGFDSSLSAMPQLTDEDFRVYAFRVLSTLPADSAVTIRLKLDYPATVDMLAALVWQYGIEGMNAELVPQRSDKRVIAIAELSVHGESLGDQIKRVRCQMSLGDGLQATGEWYADWIQVSLPLEKAMVFLSYPHLSRAEIAGKFARSDLERLVSYYADKSGTLYEIPASIEVPPGCGDFYNQT